MTSAAENLKNWPKFTVGRSNAGDTCKSSFGKVLGCIALWSSIKKNGRRNIGNNKYIHNFQEFCYKGKKRKDGPFL